MSRTRKSCPICHAPAAGDHKPFCSKACSDEDLGHWLGGKYRIPGKQATEEEMAAELEKDNGEG